MSKLTPLLLPLLYVVFFSSTGVFAQEGVSDGIKSFRSGNFDAAIVHLRASEDPVELSFLGQAYEAVNKKGDAGKAYERSLKAGYALFDKALNEWSTSKPPSSFAAALRKLSEILSVSISSAESAVRLKGGMTLNNEWRVKANALFEMKKLEMAGEDILHWDAVDVELRTLAIPHAALSGTACHEPNMNDVHVLLWVVFHKDGRTLAFAPRSKWKNGCNESAMAAATRIRFEPAQKDGKAVTTIRSVSYGFSIR